LAEKEDRARRQRELLDQFGPPVLCLTLNIPGAYKCFPLARRCCFEGLEALKRCLRAEGIIIRHEETGEGAAGYRALIAAGGEGFYLKELAIYIEEQHPLGRLFDIDVLEERGKISRTALKAGERKCLICGGSAFACGRSRAHGLEELSGAVIKIMENFFREKLGTIISGAALGALMGEAAITPKPGLVDRANTGAHRDMDFFTFINSSAAIIPYFRDCALAGFESAPIPDEKTAETPAPEKTPSPVALFNSLRRGGKIAELVMREASGGVNTHRGLIFSLGILSAAFGRRYRHDEKPGLRDLLALCRSMTARLYEDFSQAPGGGRSHGEALYARYGIGGVRGEAFRGFPTVEDLSLPAFRRLLDEGYSLNDAGVAVFLLLLAHTEDTNIVHRSSPEVLKQIQENAAAFLAAKPGVEEMRKKAAELDGEFISLNISPGGSADLLAVTLFLHRLLYP
ncbi:MAG: citrate lyase holo-[acyl-carrier protein] synthase, partial [Treponema sp.]|nr:citrate lyase holo-[acyl-carrier protein] synthase [Treponema sp.]